jgi:hypothetical protein
MNPQSVRVSTWIACASVLLAAGSAQAVPAFARKTGLACSSCHEVWPRLNDFGQLFRDRGYRLKRDRDAPVEQDPSFWPLAMRTTVGYQWLRSNLVPTDTGPSTTQTGTFGFTGLDVFAVGTLGEKVSFLITYTPGLDGAGFQLSPSGSDLESAFLGFNDIYDSSWLNLRVGKHALDQPVDEHRQITLTQPYNVYHFHPQGSIVAWEVGKNQPGLEFYGHSELSRVRYSISFVNERDSALFSQQIVSNPVLWGHFTGQQNFDSRILAAAKAGVFGSIGWHPTASLTLTPPAGPAGSPPPTPAPVNGTGFAPKQHLRYGAELHLQFLSIVNPLTLTGVVWGGSEDAALITPATPGTSTQTAKFLGGFVEGVWTVNPRLTFVARWERIINTQQGDPTLFGATGNLTAVTGTIRHTFELTSRTEAALHLEVSRVGTEAPDGTVPDVIIGLLGFDFTL